MKKTYVILSNTTHPTNRYHRVVLAIELQDGKPYNRDMPNEGVVTLGLPTGKKGKARQESFPTGLVVDVLPLDIIEVEVLDYAYGIAIVDPYTLRYTGIDSHIVKGLSRSGFEPKGFSIVKAKNLMVHDTEPGMLRGKNLGFSEVLTEKVYAMPVVDPMFCDRSDFDDLPDATLVIDKGRVLSVLF